MTVQHQSAVVARAAVRPGEPESYLQLTPVGAASWVQDPGSATAFASMREATRAAMRLPATLRAFGLPLTAH